MDHKGTQTIETKRLVLRRFSLLDADAAFRNWCSDDAVTEFLTWPTHESVEVTRSVITQWVADYDDPKCYQWAIELRELGEPIGAISSVNMDERVDAIEVGYCIGRAWWHRGIMTEAFRAVIDFFFSEVGAMRVCAEHDANNPHSGDVMRKCGLTYEGTLRRSGLSNHGVADLCVYGILREEWQAARDQGGRG